MNSRVILITIGCLILTEPFCVYFTQNHQYVLALLSFILSFTPLVIVLIKEKLENRR